MRELDNLTGRIIRAALRIHTKLGPGLLESVHETVLARDLGCVRLLVERQKPVSFDFEGLWFADAFRVDLFVERTVAVEIKSVPALVPAHHKQLLTYVRLLGVPRRPVTQLRRRTITGWSEAGPQHSAVSVTP